MPTPGAEFYALKYAYRRINNEDNFTPITKTQSLLITRLLVSYVTNSIMAHPAYVSYANITAGHAPKKILVDSDLDIGLETDELINALEMRGIEDETPIIPYGEYQAQFLTEAATIFWT